MCSLNGIQNVLVLSPRLELIHRFLFYFTIKIKNFYEYSSIFHLRENNTFLRELKID